MFTDLLDFGYKRSSLQALGFYIAYLVIFMIIGVIMTSSFFTLFHPANNQAVNMTAMHIGKAVAFVGSNVLCFAIGLRKGYKLHINTILTMFLSGILSFIFGAIGGLIPAAFFTTFKSRPSATNSADAQKADAAKRYPDDTM